MDRYLTSALAPRFTLTMNGTPLKGDITLSGLDGTFSGDFPEEWAEDIVIGAASGPPFEMTITFRAWADAQITTYDGKHHLRLEWRLA